MLSIQANEQGIPVVIERSGSSFIPVDAVRWKEITTSELGDEVERPIVPIQALEIVKDSLDKLFAERIRNECFGGCNEEDHSNADSLLCELLTSLGCAETVAAWGKVGKWYA